VAQNLRLLLIEDSSDDAELVLLVRSTIDLAHNLGLTVVAEGVENEDVQARLQTLAATSCRARSSARRARHPTCASGWGSRTCWG
jgi:predicted signal transduction protein with EAL and GGDEF domain